MQKIMKSHIRADRDLIYCLLNSDLYIQHNK